MDFRHMGRRLVLDDPSAERDRDDAREFRVIQEKYLILDTRGRKLDPVGSKRKKADSVNRPFGIDIAMRAVGMLVVAIGHYD